jgi:hypothetical protein
LRVSSVTDEPLASKACIQLSSKYRWAVSGTPVINSIEGMRLCYNIDQHRNLAKRHRILPLPTVRRS